MKVLFISDDLIGGNLAYIMKQEGCDVKLYIASKQQRNNFHNLVQKTSNWRRELKWVGKDGLIVFDYIGYGEIQDKLREKGYSVFGGSKIGDLLEDNRQWSQNIFKKYGLKTLPTINFANIEKALSFLKKKVGPWVIKQNGHASKVINYVGHFSDNRDVISVLKNYRKNYGRSLGTITLQRRVYGVEVGVGRYFNGHDWVGPIEINVEHKKFFPGDLGPTTGEMGTVAWYDDNENNQLFQATLAKLKPFLTKIDYRGDFDIGCIANAKGVFTLEATPRMGSPIVHLHSELHLSPWSQFLKAIADKKPFDLKWKRGFGIVIMVSLPPFPYSKKMKGNTSFGIEVCFDSSMTNKDLKHIHFEEISLEDTGNQKNKKYYISDHRGYVLYVTAIGNTIEESRQRAHRILGKIYIPKMFYRNDIGVIFEKEGIKKLKSWNYI